MTFLWPLGLLGLFSVPVLLWLWRLAVTHRQVRVPSLVPFERLLRRAPPSRTHLVVNLLFWLQLAAFLGTTLALAQPVLLLPRTKTILAVLDTSASMGARRRGPSALAQAVASLRGLVARKAPADQVFIMTTAPIAPVLHEPTSDGLALTKALQTVHVGHLGGNLSAAFRIGRSLLGRAPDALWVATDEPRPTTGVEPSTRWITVGQPLPNVAIVGVETQGALCEPAESRLVVTVQNFSAQPATVDVTAAQGGRRLASVRAEVAARARAPLALTLPEAVRGSLRLSIDAREDALAVDNHAWVALPEIIARPILVQIEQPTMAYTITAWLNACQALAWSSDASATPNPALVITDHEGSLAPATLMLRPPTNTQPILSHWMVTAEHPIGAYLPALGVVAVPLDASAQAPAGTPVIVGLVNGRRVPIVVAQGDAGRRTVTFHFDPSGQETTPALLVTFFNSLQWLLGQQGIVTTGLPIAVGGWSDGSVNVRRPDGTVDVAVSRSGMCEYPTTTLAGLYELSQGRVTKTVMVNFVDPLESDVMERASTWVTSEQAQTSAPPPTRRATQPLAPMILMAMGLLLLLEWWVYVKRQSVVRGP